MSELRVGIGIDAHAFSDGAKLVLGGVELSGRGLAGHSDGDVVSHALIALVHDAARPILPEDVIGRVLGGLGEDWDGVVAGLPLADTVKRVDQHGRVAETVDRTGLYAIQTPQAFSVATLRDALMRGGDASDCAGLVEAAGGRVRVVEGDPRLVKITTASDLAFVETLLANE